MNFIKFLYDVFVWITSNYSQMPVEFKAKFPETDCINARCAVNEIFDTDSELNQDFVDYE